MRRPKKKPTRKPPTNENVVSIVGDVQRRLAAEAERRASATQRRETEAEAGLARTMADIEEMDLEAAIAACDELPPEEARTIRAAMRCLHALQRCLRGDVAGGLAEWEELFADVPDVARNYLTRADWLGRTDPKAAIADVDRALALEPNSAISYQKRGGYHIALGELDRALADYRRAIAIDPERPDAHYQIGRIFAARAENAEALAAFDRAVQLAPKYVDFRVARGEVLLRLGHHERALWDFDRALTNAPRDAEAHVGRGRALGMLGNRRGAIAALSRGIDLAPGHAMAHMFRAIFRDGEEGEAGRLTVKADLARAVELDPANVAIRLKRSDYLLEFGDLAEALADVEKGLALAPVPVPRLHYNRAACKRRLAEARREAEPSWQEPEEERRERCTAAIDDLERAIALGLSTEDVYVELVRAHVERGDGEGVVPAVLDRALAAVPDGGVLLAMRYAWRVLRGDEPGAAADRARLVALGLDPDNPGEEG